MSRSTQSIFTTKRIHSGVFFESNLIEKAFVSAVQTLHLRIENPINSLIMVSALTGIHWRRVLAALRGESAKILIDAYRPCVEIEHRFTKNSLLQIEYPLPESMKMGLKALAESNLSEPMVRQQIRRRIGQLGTGVTMYSLTHYIHHYYCEARIVHMELLTGTLTQYSPAAYYYPIQHLELLELSILFQENIFSAANIELAHPEVRPPSGWTSQVIETALVAKYLNTLQEKTRRTPDIQLGRKANLEQLNWWSCYLFSLCETSLGCRPNHLTRWRLPMLLKPCVHLEDKGVNSRRVLPMPNTLTQAALAYEIYLCELKVVLAAFPRLVMTIDRIIAGKAPAFFHFSHIGAAVTLQPMTKALRSAWLSQEPFIEKQMKCLPPNFGRRHLQHQVRNQFSFSLANRWFGYCAAHIDSPKKTGGLRALNEIRDYIDVSLQEWLNDLH